MSYLAVNTVSKSFGDFTALNQVVLHVNKGSIHAVLGENGAGKTTLMNILFGLYRPDEGDITIDGQPAILRSPNDAIKHRIGMIHQHFHLASALTVTENVVLGLGRAVSMTNLQTHARRIGALSEQFGFEIDPFAPVWKLPMGMRQRVEILKALYRGADILVLDEPTSVLAPSEVTAFLGGMKKLREAGATILFVTHKLDEVMHASDAVTVMRNGNVVAELRTAETSSRELSRLMLGREICIKHGERDTAPGGPALECVDLVARGDRQTIALDRFSLTLRAGEVLGVTGIDGNGQRELAEVIAGLRPLDGGRIEVLGSDISRLGVRERLHEVGIGFVPEDRQSTGLVLDHSIADNFMLRSFYRRPAARHGLLDRAQVAKDARALIERYDIRVRSPRQAARTLSGGNQQKIVLAREIEAKPRILVVMQPTKGLDVGAIEFVQRKILEQRAQGVAVLYISTELEHMMEVADRIGVMHRGRLTGMLVPSEVTAERISLLMAGLQPEAA